MRIFSLFRSRRRRHRKQGGKGVSPLVSKKVVRESAHRLEAMRLKDDALSRRLKTLKANSLGRLENAEITRRVLDRNTFPHNRNLDNIPEKTDYVKSLGLRRDEKLHFDKDSEICRSRKERRDDIMRRTGGKGLKVKNALWNYTSYIQCR